jgi:predicted NACHT family NTPase
VEGASAALPLLIELREYALAGVSGFLAFLHGGRSADWHLDEQQLHQHLLGQGTVVMFDGLDEVFDRATQSTIVDEIVRFSQMYPLAQVLVTSRIIGYNPERLQNADFKQFTIQPLDQGEIHEFIDRWYDLALGIDADKVRLVTRLKDAIANSKAIQNLADNPLLLTMMAILNRRQELPRDRADLYDQASRVLLYHWDVDHKRLQLPMDAIGRREKQEMLRLIAYEMQTSEEGLKGNLIQADRLVRILTDYLRDQGFEAPREKANGLIEQLRHRNWILCDRGADTYGFVHRTFLEYFCAMEIVHRFEKVRSITFEELRDEVFGLHWQDETWHEVLKLICGAIDVKFAGILIEFLMSHPLENYRGHDDKSWAMSLFISAQCLSDVKNLQAIEPLSQQVMHELKGLAECRDFDWSDSTAPSYIVSASERSIQEVLNIWGMQHDVKYWLRDLVEGENWAAQAQAIEELVKHDRGNSETLSFLKEVALSSHHLSARRSSIEQLSTFWRNDGDTLKIIEQCAIDEDQYLRKAAIELLSEKWILNTRIFDLLAQRITLDDYADESDEEVIFVGNRLKYNPRYIALNAVFQNYPTHPKTLELLHNRALNDPNHQLRTWAQEQLQKLEAST